jgi:hypothetical protein
VGGYADILSTLGIGQFPRRMGPAWTPNARTPPFAGGNPVGTPIPMDTDPTLQNMDTSGAGVGPNSSAPPNLGRTPASTTAYEETLANPPQRRGGLRGVLGTATEIAGGLANVPALSQVGTRIGWGPNPNDPTGARTPEEYQRNLQRLGIMNQIDQRNLQQQYLNEYRQQRIQNQQETQAFQRQKDQENRQQQFGAWQGGTEPLQQTPNTGVIAPTPTPSQLPTSSADPVPGSMIGTTRSMPPAFDPGTGAQKPAFGGAPFVTQPPNEQGKLLTRADPSSQQPETRFQPSPGTMAARKAAEGKSPLSAGEQVYARQSGLDPGALYSDEEKKQIRSGMLKPEPADKTNTPDFRASMVDKYMTDATPDQKQRYIMTGQMPDKVPGSEAALAYAASKGDKTAADALQKLNAGKSTINLTPEAIQYWAQSAAAGVPLPSMGMGPSGAKAREQIINAAPQAAGGVPLTAARASVRADTASLAKTQSMRDAVVAFENTAVKNLDLFTKTAKPVIDSGSPWINQPLRTVAGQGLGNTDLAAYNAARQVALTEVARVVNNPTLSGQLSDSARKEVMSLNSPNATLAQIYRVVGVLKQDMANRHQSLDQQLTEIKGRMGGGPPASAPVGGSVVDDLVKQYGGR